LWCIHNCTNTATLCGTRIIYNQWYQSVHFIFRRYANNVIPLLLCFASFRVDRPYSCEDEIALKTADNWIVSCPPNEDIVSRSLVTMTELPDLSLVREIGKYNPTHKVIIKRGCIHDNKKNWQNKELVLRLAK